MITVSLNLSNIKNLCRKATNSLKLSYSDLKNIDETVICNTNIKDKHSNKIKKRTNNIKLPLQITGDMSGLNNKQKEAYIRVLKNSAAVDKNGQIIRIGILDNKSLNKIINNIKDEYSANLNVVNQRAAKHIVGLIPGNSHLRVKPFDILCEYVYTNDFIKGYITGTLSIYMKEAIGKIYAYRHSNPLYLIKKDSEFTYINDEAIISLYNQCTGKDWSQDKKYDYLIKLLSREDINSDFMAIQLLERGFIYCDDIKIYCAHMAMNNFLDKEHKYPY